MSGPRDLFNYVGRGNASRNLTAERHRYPKGVRDIHASSARGSAPHLAKQDSLQCGELGCARIAPLLGGCRPAAVGWLVVAVNVNAIDRCAIWSLPHVSQKVFELRPPLANNDAATAVIHPRVSPRIATPGHHCLPGPVRRSCRRLSGQLAGLAVREMSRPVRVRMEASARSRASASERTGSDPRLISAVALANPRPMSAGVSPGNRQSSISLANDLQRFPHPALDSACIGDSQP